MTALTWFDGLVLLTIWRTVVAAVAGHYAWRQWRDTKRAQARLKAAGLNGLQAIVLQTQATITGSHALLLLILTIQSAGSLAVLEAQARAFSRFIGPWNLVASLPLFGLVWLAGAMVLARARERRARRGDQ